MTISEKMYNFFYRMYQRNRFLEAVNDNSLSNPKNVEVKFDQELPSNDLTPQQEWASSKKKFFEVAKLEDQNP